MIFLSFDFTFNELPAEAIGIVVEDCTELGLVISFSAKSVEIDEAHNERWGLSIGACRGERDKFDQRLHGRLEDRIGRSGEEIPGVLRHVSNETIVHRSFSYFLHSLSLSPHVALLRDFLAAGRFQANNFLYYFKRFFLVVNHVLCVKALLYCILATNS